MKWLFGSIFGILAVVFLLIGCPFFLVGVGFYVFVDLRTQDWVPVTGTVTGMSQSQTTDSEGFTSDSYCPYVAFTTTEGEEIEVNSIECANPPAYETGDTIELKYNPENPRDIQLKGGVMQILSLVFKIVFGGLGALLSIAGVVLGIIGIIVVIRRG